MREGRRIRREDKEERTGRGEGEREGKGKEIKTDGGGGARGRRCEAGDQGEGREMEDG